MKFAAVLWLVGWAFVGLPWRSFSAQPSFRNVRLVPFEGGSRVAYVLNVLAFVPCGMIGVGLGWSASRAVLSGTAISVSTEFLQLFSRRRFPTTTDVILNSLGTAIGAGLGAAGRRQRKSLHGPSTM